MPAGTSFRYRSRTAGAGIARRSPKASTATTGSTRSAHTSWSKRATSRRRASTTPLRLGERRACRSSATSRSERLLVLLPLSKVVGDLEPLRLRADEDVLGRADARRISERAERDVHPRAVAHDGVEQRPADAAARVVAVVVAPDQELVAAVGELELRPFDAGEGLECGAGRRPAVRAVAVRRVPELVRHAVANGSAFALALEHAFSL